jgi:NitT/TauT family transport system substrate-binding protein
MIHRSFARRLLMSSLLLGLALVMWGDAVPSAQASMQLNYRQKWLFNTSTIGDLYADTHGYFKARGLSVTLKEGGPERDAIKELELGYAQFGVASADQVIRARAKGAPVVVIAQLFQVNPLQWIYRVPQTSIQRLDDLKGKVIGITYGGNDETIMRTLLSMGKIAEDEVSLFSVRYDYTPFYQRKVDIWPVYRNAQGVILSDKLAQANETVGFFNPAAFGVKFVANSVVTSEEMLRKHPQVVAQFKAALLQGWREALAPQNEAEAIKTLQQFDRDTPLNILQQQHRVTRELIHPSPDQPIGAIDVNGWEMTARIMLEQGQITSPVSLEAILKPVLPVP